VTHLHVVDGVLPAWLVVLTLVAAGAIVALALLATRPEDQVVFLSRVGVMGGALLVAMAIPLGPGVHLTLAPLAGILLGARGGFLAAFLTNAVLSGFGHGGITALGLNGCFVGAQAALAALLFARLRRTLSPRRAAAVATGVALVWAAAVAIRFLASVDLGGEGHGRAHGDEAHGWVGTAIVVALALGAAWIETALTAGVVEFLARARADLVHGEDPGDPGEAPAPEAPA